MTSSVDLLDLKSVEKFAKEATEKFGCIHSVVFATGPFLHILPVTEAEPVHLKSCLIPWCFLPLKMPATSAVSLFRSMVVTPLFK